MGCRSIATSAAPARGPAGADDEHPQRRQARRQHGRLPGVHDRPVGRADVRRGAAHGRRGLPRAARVLHERGLSTRRRRRGRLRARPRLATRTRSQVLVAAIEAAGYKPGKDVAIALDPAASELYERRQATCSSTRGARLSSRGDDRLWAELAARAIRSCRSRTAWPRTIGTGWRKLTERSASSIQLVGDDIFVTNTERLARGHRGGRRQRDPDQGQPDRHADRDARRDRAGAQAGYAAVISHRSGETEDTTIADLAVATSCGQIKTGSPSRSDRVAKYNQLLRIEEQLGDGRRVPRRLGVSLLSGEGGSPPGANARAWPVLTHPRRVPGRSPRRIPSSSRACAGTGWGG